MSDLSGALAAILAETPVHPTRRDALVDWRPDDLDDLYWPIYGDPAPVAARQAAAARPAILRELADELEAREAPAEGKIWLIDARWLRKRADEIEEANRG